MGNNVVDQEAQVHTCKDRMVRIRAYSDLEGYGLCKHQHEKQKPVQVQTWRPEVHTSTCWEDQGLGKGEMEWN